MNTPSDTIFAALSDPTRLSIIDMLASRGELTVSEISKVFSITPPAISQHLKVLREAGLTLVKKRGQQRLYSLNPAPITEVEQWLEERIRLWNSRLDAMEAYIIANKEKQHEK